MSWLYATPPSPSARPTDQTTLADSEYASSKQCKACHTDTYATWDASYHQSMTQAATPQTVVAQWDQTLTEAGKTYRLYKDDDRFMVDMPDYGTDGTDPKDRVTREVVMTTGSHHMQIYWMPIPWYNRAPQHTGSSLFQTHCIQCHGQDEEQDLTDRSLVRDELADRLATPEHQQHLTSPLNETQTTAILNFVEELQVMGNLQQLPFAWWIRDDRWIHEEHTFLQPPRDPESLEYWEQRWSNACDQCHSVHTRSTWNAETARKETTTVDLGIACEACHGPAKAHADHYRNPITRYLARTSPDAAEHIVHPRNLDHKQQSALCGQCHGELVYPHGFESNTWRPGERLEDHVHVVQYHEAPYPEWLQPTLDDEPDLMDSAFWKDGTMRVAGRDYNGMAMSGCYTKGEMSCMSCHELHGHEPNDQLKPGYRGDAACADCHPAHAEAGSAHTHHAPESEGSRCMNCQMPNTTIGLLGAMRSHRIDSPNANTADQSGRPDACSLCHLDTPLSDTAKTLTQWYGQPPLQTLRLTENEPSAAVLWFLKGDAAQRALILWHMGWSPAQHASGVDWMVPYLSIGLTDDYAAVRYIAGAALQTHPTYASVSYDYTHTVEHRDDVADTVLTQWENTVQPKSAPSTLMTPEPDWPRIETYLMMRDTSPVSVSE